VTRDPRRLTVQVTIANISRRIAHLTINASETDDHGQYAFAVTSGARRPDWSDRRGRAVAAGTVATGVLTFVVDPNRSVVEIVVAPELVGRSGSTTLMQPDHVIYTIPRG
jgi:alkyl hydroperoxide reductase subunit AhpC